MPRLPRNVDVAIMGGGFAGLATAWWLSRTGVHDVLVFERESELGRYASGRCAGLGRQVGEDDLMSSFTVTGAAYLRQFFPRCWTETGGLLTFDNASAARGYAARAKRMSVPATCIERGDVLAFWPQLNLVDIAAGVHVPSDGIIDVKALLAAYAEHMRVALDTVVERIIATPGGATLLTSRGSFVARIVVDATGACAGQVTGSPLLDSFKRHVFLLEAPAPPRVPFVWHMGAREFCVREADEQIMVSPCDATKAEPGDQQCDDTGEALMRTRLAGSPIGTAPIARAWAYQRTFAPRPPMKLEVDPKRPWLIWAAGLGGHDATASAVVGETVARLVVEALARM